MPRGSQITRFYGIVGHLARSSRGVPAAVLAERFRARPRTIYRDLQALKTLGFPVVATGSGKWKLKEGWRDRIPFPSPLAELLALHLARRVMGPLRGTRAAKDLDSLIERISGVSPQESPRQGELFPRIRALIETPGALAIDYSGHESTIELLCRACESRTTIRAAYVSVARGLRTKRLLDPYALYFDPRLEALYVFAWCHLRKEVRTFATHRFEQVALTEKKFERPTSFSVEGYLRDSFQLWHAKNAVTIKLALEPGLRWVAERMWHPSQKKRRLPSGRFELELTVANTAEVRRFILGLGKGVEVVEPMGLRREIAREHAEAAMAGSEPRRSATLDDTRRAIPTSRAKATRLRVCRTNEPDYGDERR